MTLTAEQKDALHCDEDLMLTACPGSGKTRVIISKLSRVIDEIRETPRAIACITYTNAAVQEIESRLRHHLQPGDDAYYDICTIHSFCLNHVFRPRLGIRYTRSAGACANTALVLSVRERGRIAGTDSSLRSPNRSAAI